MSVRVRFAPSPTGSLHIGGVRTVLFAELFARQNHGALVLRIEDTDQERLVAGAVDTIYDGLAWVGIRADEGPREGGPHAPYIQSQRLPLYREHAMALVEGGSAYFCFCTKERLDELRAFQRARGDAVTRYDGRCREIEPRVAAERAAAESHVVRLKVPETGTIAVHDLVYGDIEWPLGSIDDQVLLKSDGFPTYHLAVVVDDHVMGITHIFRAEDWQPSTPKHLLVYRAFGWSVPEHAHLPNVLGPDGKKLSKRHGATAVSEFRSRGFIPEGMTNYLALLGWAPGTEDEVFSHEELVDRFRIEQVQHANAHWDEQRLLYFNGLWIRRLEEDDLFRRVSAFVPESWDREILRATIPHIRERMRTLAEARDQVAFLFTDDVPRTADVIVPKKHPPAEVAAALGRAAVLVRYAEPFDPPTIDALLRALAEELGWPVRDVHYAVRGAVTGSRVGFSLYESIVMLGRERTLDRLEKAAEALD
jgi:glutamyl-tRNA synthetase